MPKKRRIAVKRIVPHQWTHLPVPVLEKIFGYLDSRDRWSVMQICPYWEKVLMTPGLWESVVFRFPHHRMKPEIEGAQKKNTALQFVRKFGAYMRHVTISYRRPTFGNRRRVQREITGLLKGLRNTTQLHSFNMSHLTLHHNWVSDRPRKRLVEAVQGFLLKQKNLKRVSLTNSDCYRWEAIRIMEQLMGSFTSLKELNLQNFLQAKSQLIRNLAYRRLIPKLSNLRTLSINCSGLSQNLLATLFNNNTRLAHFTITSRRKEHQGMTVGVGFWRQVAAKRPQLQVHYVVEKLEHISVIYRRLPPGTPIHSFRFVTSETVKTGESARLPGTMPALSWYLCRYFRDTLEHIDLDFGRFQSPTLSVAVQTLIANLPHLRTLKVRAGLSPSGWLGLLYECFNSAHELQEVNLIFVQSERKVALDELRNEIHFYVEVFHNKGVTLNHKNFL